MSLACQIKVNINLVFIIYVCEFVFENFEMIIIINVISKRSKQHYIDVL